MLFFTDGVTERRVGSRMLEEDGLARLLASSTGLTAAAVAHKVRRAVVEFQPEPPRDDLAVLALRVC